jgi:hypothetical protein
MRKLNLGRRKSLIIAIHKAVKGFRQRSRMKEFGLDPMRSLCQAQAAPIGDNPEVDPPYAFTDKAPYIFGLKGTSRVLRLEQFNS